MKPVNSTIEHKPEEGKFGNCFQACMASILELPIEHVPHFYDNADERENAQMSEEAKQWVNERTGYTLIDVPFIAPQGNEHFTFDLLVKETLAFLFPNIHVMVTGKSGGGDYNHIVIVKDGEVVHDPNDSGIEGPCVGVDLENAYWVTFFAVVI